MSHEPSQNPPLPKSILKKPTQPAPQPIQESPQPDPHQQNAEVVWDEKNLQLNEEERIAAGPRMKIEEPKTPFHESIHPDHDDFADDFSLGAPAQGGQAVSVNNNINNTQDNNNTNNNTNNDNNNLQGHHLSQPNLSHLAHQNMLQNAIMLTDNLVEESSEEEDERYTGLSNEERDQEEEKHRRFDQMRKQHYNMKGQMFKKAANPLKAFQSLEDSEEESGEDYQDQD